MKSTESTRRLFELEDDGTILHCDQGAERSAARPIGTNFFDATDVPYDIAEFRRQFRNFIHGHRAMESFTLSLSGKKRGNAKFLLTKAFNTAYQDPKEIVMLEIRGL